MVYLPYTDIEISALHCDIMCSEARTGFQKMYRSQKRSLFSAASYLAFFNSSLNIENEKLWRHCSLCYRRYHNPQGLIHTSVCLSVRPSVHPFSFVRSFIFFFAVNGQSIKHNEYVTISISRSKEQATKPYSSGKLGAEKQPTGLAIKSEWCWESFPSKMCSHLCPHLQIAGPQKTKQRLCSSA